MLIPSLSIQYKEVVYTEGRAAESRVDIAEIKVKRLDTGCVWEHRCFFYYSGKSLKNHGIFRINRDFY